VKSPVSKNRMVLFIITLAFLFSPLQTLANTPLQVAIIPFTINAEKDYTYLQNGITEMLTFHLSKEGKAAVVDPELIVNALKGVNGPLNNEKAKQIAQKLKADYIVYGNISVFGKYVSVQGKALDLSGKSLPVPLLKELSSIDGIIPEINGFAAEIKKAISATSFSKKHLNVAQGLQNEKKESSASAIIKTSEPANQAMQGFWKSENIEAVIRSLAIGDINNDGIKEILILSSHAIDVYHLQQSKLVKEKTFFSDDDLNMISIDIADINQNGFPEIFVTSLNALNNSVSSLVIEYNQGDYSRIVEDVSWYFKVVGHETLGNQLFGQRQKTGRSDIFSGAIFKMKWENNQYEPENQVLSENNSNLLGFTYGNILNNGEDGCIILTKEGSLEIIDPSGNRIWSGKELYTELPFYFMLPKEEPGIENRQYYPMRLGLHTDQGDGKKELIVIKNPGHAGSFFNFLRSDAQAHIVSLSWDGLGLSSNWKTRSVSGTITDFVIDDVDSDGKGELVLSLILDTGAGVGSSPRSVIVSYDLN
jgi:TolB-like protein